jgi:hypothetical protein
MIYYFTILYTIMYYYILLYAIIYYYYFLRILRYVPILDVASFVPDASLYGLTGMVIFLRAIPIQLIHVNIG